MGVWTVCLTRLLPDPGKPVQAARGKRRSLTMGVPASVGGCAWNPRSGAAETQSIPAATCNPVPVRASASEDINSWR